MKKTIYFREVNDKILPIENLKNSDHKIYLFSEISDKKSKIRNYFEKSKEEAVVACYPDNDLTIGKNNFRKLKAFKVVP